MSHWHEAGLLSDSVVKAGKLVTLHKDLITKGLGKISFSDMLGIDKHLAQALDLSPSKNIAENCEFSELGKLNKPDESIGFGPWTLDFVNRSSLTLFFLEEPDEELELRNKLNLQEGKYLS